MQQTFESLKERFGSMAKARGYAMELKHSLDEDEFDKDQIYAANLILSQIKEYLAMGDEYL